MNYSDISEIVAGLVYSGRASPKSVDASKLEPPYDQIVRLIQKGKDQAFITMEVGLSIVASITAASEQVPEKDEVGKYLKLLEDIAIKVEVGNKLSLAAKQLLKGTDIDIPKTMAILSRMDSGISEFETLDKIEPEHDMMIPTYWHIWDEHFGGIPRKGMTLLAAPPKTGKTTSILKLINEMTKAKKEVGLLSLEMPSPVVLARWIEMNEKLTKAQRSRVHISDAVYSIDEAEIALTRLVTQHPDLHCIFIDFADLLVAEDEDESTEAAGRIYRIIAKVSKTLGKPIILLCQLNSNYVGGIPRVNHIRWTRLAEALASMIVLLYNPDRLWVDQGQNNAKPQQLPHVAGKGYLILGASRYKTPHKRLGAIQLAWSEHNGTWDDSKAGWFPL